MQEKSKNIFENSLPGTIGARIKVLLEKTGKSVTDLETDGQIGNGTLKSWKEKSIDFSSNVVESFKRNLKIREDWWKTEEGEVFLTQMPKPNDNNGKAQSKDEVYRNIVEGNTEYILIPRSVLSDSYRIVPLEQIERDNKVLDRLLTENEKMFDEIVRLRLQAELPKIKKTK